MELSQIEYNRLKGDTIHLISMSFNGDSSNKGKQILYSKITYGNNINKTIKQIVIGNCNCYNMINLHKMKSQFVLITANKEEYEQHYPNIFIFDTCKTQSIDETKRNDRQKNTMSGIVVLIVGVSAKPDNKEQCNFLTTNQ